MPRDLTDLMESATRVAPPEPHDAAHVTSLAASRLQRRRAGLAGAVVLVVVVAGGLGYGATRGHDTTPEPADHYKHDQTIGISAAVPARSLPGYQAQPWTLPSVQQLGAGKNPLATYHDVDAEGRLITETVPGNDAQNPPQYRLYAGPGQSAQPLQVPPSPGKNAGQPIGWIPSFLDDGRLLWTPDRVIVDSAASGFHITDLQGGHDEFVHTGFTVGKESFDGSPNQVTGSGVSGDRSWFLVYDHNLPHLTGVAYSLFTATFSGSLTKVADDVAVMDVNDGVVAWVTTDGKVETESATGAGSPQSVDVPLGKGCQVSSTDVLQNLHPFVVGHSVIALTEQCGKGKAQANELLALDPSGRQLVHLSGLTALNLALGGDGLLVQASGATGGIENLRYDLETGTLVRLSPALKSQVLQTANGAGDFVLWYDAKGGHVVRIPG